MEGKKKNNIGRPCLLSLLILFNHLKFDKKKKDKLNMILVSKVLTVSGRGSVFVAVSLSHVQTGEAK